MAQNRREVKRRMEFLMAEGGIPLGADWGKIYNEACIAIATGITYNDCLNAPYAPMDYAKPKHIRLTVQVVILGIELAMGSEEIKEKWLEIYKMRRDQQNEYSKRPQGETRDNKGTYVGSGGSHGNKIRYPKKNRSKKVWAMFYKMFPWAARYDNWDGEKSDRYPKKKK